MSEVKFPLLFKFILSEIDRLDNRIDDIEGLPPEMRSRRLLDKLAEQAAAETARERDG